MRASTSAKNLKPGGNAEFGLRARFGYGAHLAPVLGEQGQNKIHSPSFVLRSTIACRKYVGPAIPPPYVKSRSVRQSTPLETVRRRNALPDNGNRRDDPFATGLRKRIAFQPGSGRRRDRPALHLRHWQGSANASGKPCNKTAEPFGPAVRLRLLCNHLKKRHCDGSDTQATRACESPR